jgi:hypothetical protein
MLKLAPYVLLQPLYTVYKSSRIFIVRYYITKMVKALDSCCEDFLWYVDGNCDGTLYKKHAGVWYRMIFTQNLSAFYDEQGRLSNNWFWWFYSAVSVPPRWLGDEAETDFAPRPGLHMSGQHSMLLAGQIYSTIRQRICNGAAIMQAATPAHGPTVL